MMKLLNNGNIYQILMPTRPSKMVSSVTLLIPVWFSTQPRMVLELDMTFQIQMPYSLEVTLEII